mgnify:CR=1 FL=1
MGDKYVAPGVGSLPPGPLSELFGSAAVPVIRVTLTDPAVSERQQKFMAMCEHDPKHARGKCPSRAVAKKFSKKPKGGY